MHTHSASTAVINRQIEVRHVHGSAPVHKLSKILIVTVCLRKCHEQKDMFATLPEDQQR